MTTTMRARPTTYKGIKMRSRLEAGYAMWLDRWVFDWEYEPQAFASDAGQYLPDFLLRQVDCIGLGHQDIYVEVKPPGGDWGCPGLLAERMRIIHESEPDALLMLAIPGDEPHLATHSAGRRHLDWQRMTWVVPGPGAVDSGLSLAAPIPPAWQPWPDGYWKGPE